MLREVSEPQNNDWRHNLTVWLAHFLNSLLLSRLEDIWINAERLVHWRHKLSPPLLPLRPFLVISLHLSFPPRSSGSRGNRIATLIYAEVDRAVMFLAFLFGPRTDVRCHFEPIAETMLDQPRHEQKLLVGSPIFGKDGIRVLLDNLVRVVVLVPQPFSSVEKA